MSDLVERLRHAFDGDSVPEKNICLRLAYDEIERLRAALHQIVERYKTAEDGWPAEDMRAMAEDALEEKAKNERQHGRARGAGD